MNTVLRPTMWDVIFGYRFGSTAAGGDLTKGISG
jgi:hypothetical protein